MRLKRILSAVCLSVLCALSGVAGAEEAAPTPAPTAAPVVNPQVKIEASIGYEGALSMDRWMPVFATVTNNGPDFDGMLGVNIFLTQTQFNRYEIPLTLASGAAARVMLPVRPMTAQDMYAVELVTDGAIVAEARVPSGQPITPETVVVGLLSDTPQALTTLNQRTNGPDTLRGEVWKTVPLTLDTFPANDDLLAAFSVLVVDGFDMGALSQAQREAVSRWIGEGGVALVSGGAKAAMGYPWFAQWTGLSAGKLAQVSDITPALAAYAGISAAPSGEGLWLSAMPETGASATQEGHGLLTLTEVGEGAILSFAFDMAASPLSGWGAMSAFWPRALRTAAPEVYARLVMRAEEYSYNDYSVVPNDVMNRLSVPNTENALLVFLLLAIYLFAVGFGVYLLLLRADRREWLWFAVPATAAVFAGILLVIGNSSEMNEPVALTASRIFLTDQGAWDVTTYVGVALPEKSVPSISTDQRQIPFVMNADGNYYYDTVEPEDKLFRPLVRRQTFQMSDVPSVGFDLTEAWQARMLRVDHVQAEIGPLTGRLWVEADGVHGEIVNDTGATLRGAVVATAFGYCVPGDILPGQTVPFAMLLPQTPIDIWQDGFEPEPNILYVALDVASAGTGGNYSEMTGRFLDAALRSQDDPEGNTDGTAWDGPNQWQIMLQLFDAQMPLYGTDIGYYLFAFNDTLGQVAVSVDGETITRTGHTAALGARLTFEPIGPTGEVLFPQGMIRSEIVVDEGENAKPRVPTPEDGPYAGDNVYGMQEYITISRPVALRFQLPRSGEYAIEEMAISGGTYGAVVPDVYLYNHGTGAWDAQLTLSIKKTGADWTPYIDADGTIYLRFVPGDSAERYDSMIAPLLALKGKVK